MKQNVLWILAGVAVVMLICMISHASTGTSGSGSSSGGLTADQDARLLKIERAINDFVGGILS